MVVDLGSHAIKAGRSVGYPSDTEPSVVLPCTVQDSRVTVVEKLVHPMHAGVVTDWEGLETLLHYTLFEELGWAPEQEGQLLVADPVLSSRSDRERLCQLAFEGLGVRGLFVADQGVLSLYAAGKTSGLVVDYGLDKTGAWIGGWLGILGREREAAEALKLACLWFPSGTSGASGAPGEEAVPAGPPATHTLPDGQTIEVEAVVREASAALLDPGSLQGATPGAVPPLAQLVAAMGAALPDREARKGVLGSLFVAGGAAGVAGLGAALAREVHAALPAAQAVAALEPPDHMPRGAARSAAWAGGAVLAKVVAAQEQWVTRGEYDEAGPGAVHMRCL
ncbi:Actin-related protein 7 [Auxenochlorella protothecoides]|uniref:Actin-related protein 7 n=1 Tax=Auxenochlorella protothecoides TaxID=3075 RepID=A0A087SU12_AUXPR|nr:Actin-related protein 7 [Auxenochlorella protothecoides]KFM29216.1 Actin-related protein 7 [Auxenochlorella protothecoides]